MNRCIPFLLLPCILLFGCSSTEDGSSEPLVQSVDNLGDNTDIRFEQVATFGHESDDPSSFLSGWMSVDIGQDGTIFVLDHDVSQLKAYSAEGDFLWAKGSPGQGPGELRNAGPPIPGPDGRIHISNQGNSRIDIFSSEGDFEESFDLEQRNLTRAVLHGFLDDDTAVFFKNGRGTIGGTVHLVSISQDWKPVSSIPVDYSREDEIDERMVSFLSVGIVEGLLVTADPRSFEQTHHAIDGTVVRSTILDRSGLSGPRMVERPNGYGQVQYSGHDPIQSLDGSWFMGQSRWTVNDDEMIAAMGQPRDENSPRPDMRSALDFFDADFRLRYSLDGEQQEAMFDGNILAFDGRSHLYTFDSEEGIGIKYRVEIRS